MKTKIVLFLATIALVGGASYTYGCAYCEDGTCPDPACSYTDSNGNKVSGACCGMYNLETGSSCGCNGGGISGAGC